MKVVVATPSHDGKVSAEYKNSILQSAVLCWGQGIELRAKDALHYADIEAARSLLLNEFIQTNGDWLFWIDADGGWPPEAFMKLLLSPKEVVCGLMAKKVSDEEDYSVFCNVNSEGMVIVDPQDGMILISMIGFAFVRMARNVVDKMVERYSYPGQMVRLFEKIPNPNNNVPYGEDFSFCRKWTAIDGQIWLDPDIDTIHTGTYRWKGNYHQFLMRQPGGINDPNKIEIVPYSIGKLRAR